MWLIVHLYVEIKLVSTVTKKKTKTEENKNKATKKSLIN